MKTYIALATLIVTGVPAVAAAQDFSGPRIEARLGYETPTVSSDDDEDVYKIGSAASYGAEAGFDIRTNRIVVGPFINYEASSVELCDGIDCLSEKGNLNVGLRVGAIAGERGLVYGKLGYGQITFEARSGSTVFDSENKGGVQGAIGYEHGFGKFYGFVEAGYADYGDFYGINLQRRQVAGGVGIRF